MIDHTEGESFENSFCGKGLRYLPNLRPFRQFSCVHVCIVGKIEDPLNCIDFFTRLHFISNK